MWIKKRSGDSRAYILAPYPPLKQTEIETGEKIVESFLSHALKVDAKLNTYLHDKLSQLTESQAISPNIDDIYKLVF